MYGYLCDNCLHFFQYAFISIPRFGMLSCGMWFLLMGFISYPHGSKRSVDAVKMVLKILSYNVKGLNSPFKCSVLWRDVIKSHADIICLQETHLLQQDTHRLKRKNFIFVFHSFAEKKRAGVSILIRDSVAFQLLSSTIDPKGRYIILQCTLNSKNYTLLSLYAPNSRQLPFLRKIITKTKETQVGGLIVCGDFNLVMNRSLDRSQGGSRTAQELNPLANEEELYDVWCY